MLINPFLFPPPVPVFDPSSIASIWAYFEADSYSLSDDDSITTNWTDKSGNGRHAVPAGSPNTPKFKTNQINGEPAILFASSARFNLPSMAALTEGAYYQVTKVVTVTAGGDRFGNQGGGADHYPFTGTSIYDGWGSTTRRGPLTSLVTLTNWHLLHGWSKAGDWAIKQNNAVLSSSGTNTVAFHSAPFLGFNNSQYRNAFVPALYLFSAKLSPTDDAAMLAYINTKYGV